MGIWVGVLNKFICIILVALICLRQNSVEAKDVLIFGKTIKPAHMNIIPTAGKSLELFLSQNGFNAKFIQNLNFAQTLEIKNYDALIFLDTSEGILTLYQKKKIESYFKNGLGILAIHSSVALGNDWIWFKSLIGATFKNHPPIHSETVRRVEPLHPSIKHLPRTWTQEDEWYEFASK